MSNEGLDHALQYLENGWSVIPLQPSTKKPIKGFSWEPYQARRATQSEARAWFEQNPTANVGIVTGAISGIVAVDFDGEDGEAAVSQHVGLLPPSPTSITAKGRHVLFRHQSGIKTRAGILPSFDVRSDGGYIASAPSVHPSGHRYRWSTEVGCGCFDPISPLPPKLQALLINGGPSKRVSTPRNDWSPQVTAAELNEPIPVGQRNAKMARFAGAFLSQGLTDDEVLDLLLKKNEQLCDTPLTGDEVHKVVTSVANKNRRSKGKTQSLHRASRLVVQSLDSVQPEEVQWLWKDYLPLGAISIWDGRAGVGKSTLSLDICARVTTGASMPDGSPGIEGGVVLLNVEDSVSRTVVKRLIAAGAKLARVAVINEVETSGGVRLPTIPDDIALIAETVRSRKARLLVLDPFMSFLSSTINSW